MTFLLNYHINPNNFEHAILTLIFRSSDSLAFVIRSMPGFLGHITSVHPSFLKHIFVSRPCGNLSYIALPLTNYV